jgi:FecR protein
MTPPKRPTLDSLVEEAKGEETPDVDWAKVEAKLFPRIEREARAQAAVSAYGGPKRGWIAAAVVIAAAATVPLFFHRAETGPLVAEAAAHTAPAGTMLEKDRAAVVHVSSGGVVAATAPRELAKGGAIAEGDVIDVRAGRAIFARGEPRGVTWALEDNAQVEVRAAGETLILALAKGAVEAQVTPVAAGEAFAIDVEGTRVAVHGTHLRVERQGARAIVDLREGVISIGNPPKKGATYGDLVTAPAHVEFDPADPHGTLKVSHEISRVRTAASLGSAAAVAEISAPRPVAPIVPAPLASSSTPPRAAPPAAPVPAAPATPAAVPPAAPASAVTSPVPPPPEPAQADPNPERSVVDQIRACARKHVEHADGVVITVSTRLELRIADSGMVSAAVFDPPLRAEVQACAATAIYGTRFPQAGSVSIPIDVTP